MKKEKLYKKYLFLPLILMLAVPAVFVVAAAPPRPRTPDQMGAMPRQETLRRQTTDPQTLEQQVSEAASLLERALDDFFVQINEFKDPEEIYVKSAAVLLEDCRRYLIRFEDAAKTRYMLLQAWVEYCKGDWQAALTNSVRACRLDATNRDTWVSQQFFSLLLSKRPIQPPPVRLPGSRIAAQRIRPEMAVEISTGQSPYGTSGKLDFNPETLRLDLIGKTIKPFSASFLDGTPLDFTYPEQKSILCILVWEVPSPLLEQEESPQETDQPLLYVPAKSPLAAPEGTADLSESSFSSLVQQTEALEALRAQVKKAGRQDILFFSVITNKPEEKPAVVEHYLTQNPHPLPVLYASTAATELVLEAKTPFAAVIDENGRFRYAGSAEGFMLPMLLRNWTGIPFVKLTSQSTAGEGEHLLPEGPGDPNRPAPMAADPNSVKPSVQPRTAAPAGKESLENAEYNNLCGAEQLAAAQDFFLKAAGKRFISYRRGVDLCRYVIKNCPNSKNAEAARELLRTKIPEDQRESLGLTKEELGL